jgi:cobalamin biosynthesis protein CobT
MGRKRTRNYRELREHFDEAERREGEEEEEDDDDEDDDEEDDDEEEEEEGAEEEGAGGDEDDDDEAPAPKKKKKKEKEKVVKPRARRTRTKAAARMKIVWGVFNNSNSRVASYEYKEKQSAIDHAARLTASKPNNTHFVQPVKEPMEVKAEKAEK